VNQNLTKMCVCPRCGQYTIGIILSLTETEVEFECQKCNQIVNLPKGEAGCKDW
jgi:transposase-like protein